MFLKSIFLKMSEHIITKKINIDTNFLINIRHKDLCEIKIYLDKVSEVLEHFNSLKNDTNDVILLKEYYKILYDAYDIQNNDIFQRYKGKIKNFCYNEYNHTPTSQDVINYLQNNDDIQSVNNLILWGNVRTDAFDAIYNHETLGTNTLVEQDENINYFCIVIFLYTELYMTFKYGTKPYKWMNIPNIITTSYSGMYTIKKHDAIKRGMSINGECDVHETRYKIYTSF